MFKYLINILKNGRRIFLLFFIIILNKNLFPQEIDIVPYLKKIEEGKIEEVRKDFASLNKSNSQNVNSRGIAKEDPSLLFLEAVLTDALPGQASCESSALHLPHILHGLELWLPPEHHPSL